MREDREAKRRQRHSDPKAKGPANPIPKHQRLLEGVWFRDEYRIELWRGLGGEDLWLKTLTPNL